MAGNIEWRDAETAAKYSEEECPTDPWGDILKIHCGGYNSAVTDDILAVMQGVEDKLYMSDIAERTGLSQTHVELIQYILCSSNLAEYGTSPRACFVIDKERWADAKRRIAIGWVQP